MTIEKDISFSADNPKEKEFTIASAIDEHFEELEIEEELKNSQRSSQVNVRLTSLSLFALDEVSKELKMTRSAAAAFLLTSAIHQARVKLIPLETSKQSEAFYQKFADSKGEELTSKFIFKSIQQ